MDRDETRDTNNNGIDDRCEILKFKVLLFLPIALIVVGIFGFIVTKYFPPSYNNQDEIAISLERQETDVFWTSLTTAGLTMLGLADKKQG